MRTLTLGTTGEDVRALQYFLIGKKALTGIADGSFGPKTQQAIQLYQRSRKLTADGFVGPKTIAEMESEGFHTLQPVANDTPSPRQVSVSGFPARPPFSPFTSNDERMKAFGHFDWVRDPDSKDGEIIIKGDWVDRNIVRVHIPQLEHLGFDKPRPFHKNVADAVVAFWADIEKEGVLEDVISYDGDFFPRLIRGSSVSLSNHAFGTAFDINAEWNGLRTTPPNQGAKGSVYRIVPIAHKHKFYWGGHFTRLDGMHFEQGNTF